MLYDKKWDNLKVVEKQPWQLLLERAADLIEQRGHCKNAVEDSKGRMCIIGALTNIAQSHNYNGFVEAKGKLILHLGLKNDGGMSLVNWNNTFNTTKEEVIVACRAAARS